MQYKFHYITTITLIVLWIFLVQIVFYFLQESSGQKKILAIESVLRFESEYRNPEIISKTIIDLEKIGTIKCTKLYFLSNGINYLDLSHKNNCSTNEWLLEGKHREKIIDIVNGSQIKVDFIAVNHTYFYFALWLTRFFGASVIFMLAFYYIRKTIILNNLYEIEKATSEKLQRMSKQVKHDVASPLSALKIISNYKGLDKKYKNLLFKSIARAEEILNDLSSEANIHISEFCLSELVREISEEKQNSRIVLRLNKANITCARYNLGRVVSNLINNSLEASNSSIVNVSIESKKESVTLKVEDNGPGFPDEILSSIAEGKSVSKPNGSGLGLFHAKNTVLGMKGDIKLFNNRGACVHLNFVR